MKKLIFLVSLIGVLVFGGVVSAAGFENNLYFGLTNNSDVSKLQEFLTTDGVYTGPITGNFYSLTLKGVKDFQEKYEISPVAGYFGPLTRAKANEILNADITASDNQAIAELGVAPKEVITKTNTELLQEQITALMSQVSLLQSQLAVQQQTNVSIQALQNQVITQTQVIQTQQESITQIVQNTTPVVAEPKPIVIEAPNVLFSVGRKEGGNITYFSTEITASIGDIVVLNVFVKKGNDYILYPNNTGYFDIQVSTPDPSQDKTIGMNYKRKDTFVNGVKVSPDMLYFAPFFYEPKTEGINTITFNSPSLNSSTTINILIE